MDYMTKMRARGAALREAYTSEESMPEHRGDASPLTNVLVDLILTLRTQDRTIDAVVADAAEIADREWYFAEPLIRGTAPAQPEARDEEAPTAETEAA